MHILTVPTIKIGANNLSVPYAALCYNRRRVIQLQTSDTIIFRPVYLARRISSSRVMLYFLYLCI
jgi:hypothetical protein